MYWGIELKLFTGKCEKYSEKYSIENENIAQ